MKKILSILFILCFLNGNYVIAQKLPHPKISTYRKLVRTPELRIHLPTVQTHLPTVQTHLLRVQTHLPTVPIRVKKVPYHVKSGSFHVGMHTSLDEMENLHYSIANPESDFLSVPTGLSESGLPLSPRINIDMENREFIHEKHLSSPSEKPSSTIENSNGLPQSESIINIHTISPKVNMDKLRMKIMKCQNRLNKNEMKADEFILIGLLINHNEYGEYYVTNYAA